MNVLMLVGFLACVANTTHAQALRHPGAPIHVRLLADVVVQRPTVTLADVAEVTGSDAPELHRLMGAVLGRVSSDGEATTLDRESLARWVRAQSGIDRSRISWSGPPASHIRLSTLKLSGETIARTALDGMKALLQQAGVAAQVEVAQTPVDVDVPRGSLELRLRTAGLAPEGAAAFVAKRPSAWVDVTVDGRFVRVVPVPLVVTALARAYVATHDLPSGEPIDPVHPGGSQFSVRVVDWAGRRARPVTVDAEGSADKAWQVGSSGRLRRGLHSGDVLTVADVDTAHGVARGDWVTLRAVQGSIEVESRVEVLQSGAAGQTVQVKLANAPTAFGAQVVDTGQVELRQ